MIFERNFADIWLHGNTDLIVPCVSLRHPSGMERKQGSPDFSHNTCLHTQRNEKERFRKIDEKRGGIGFV